MGAFGVYLHIPFCARRCDYCAFATWTDRDHLITAYLEACSQEIDQAIQAGMAPATSVFVGGGTPSLVPPADLVKVLHRIPRIDTAEVTVECNPDTVTQEMLETYRGAGVNRLSFGVQSMVPEVLSALGRTHNPENVLHSVQMAREAGFESFNLDLIYGGAGETVQQWRQTIEEVLDLDPPHVSAYALTVEPGTPLAGEPNRHPDDDDLADKYLLATELLARADLCSYEISNWARPGHECAHNLLYWDGGNYQGFGCAAHSHADGRRWWNLRTPERYIAAVSNRQSTIAATEELTPAEQALERWQLQLRTATGVPLEALDSDIEEQLPGLVRQNNHRWVLTAEGRLLANEVALRLRLPSPVTVGSASKS